MKEASGELNMTVVTIVAIAAVGAFFYAFVWPGIQQSIANSTCKNVCPGGEGTANKVEGAFKTCTCADGSSINIE